MRVREALLLSVLPLLGAPATPEPGGASTLSAPNARRAGAQVPALEAAVETTEGGLRGWTLATRIDVQFTTVTATSPGATLAVIFRHGRTAPAVCRSLAALRLRTEDVDPFRAAAPSVFRAPAFEADAWRQETETHEAEFGCLQTDHGLWFGTVLADRRAGVSVADGAAVAQRLGEALGRRGARNGWPVLLPASQLEVADPRDGAAWLFTGHHRGLGFQADVISAAAGDRGGVTLTLARPEGTCSSIWERIRGSFRDEGAVVDRPGYVPESLGTRIRRIERAERTREIYCAPVGGVALFVSAIFRTGDGEAMTRMLPLLRAVVRAAEHADRPSPAPVD